MTLNGIKMSDRFQNKYRIPSARLRNWNYSSNGSYFITICTYDHDKLFGEIINDEMQLSQIGKIVQQEWDKSFDMRAELFCDLYVIMPNHIHAILRIEKPDNDGSGGYTVETHGRASSSTHNQTHNQSHGRASSSTHNQTHGRASLQQTSSMQNHGIAFRSPKSISSFVAGFKSVAKIRINEFRNTPRMDVWQMRFYDNIIRNEYSYNRISDYIINNPKNWNKDKFR
jgi:putative transposase